MTIKDKDAEIALLKKKLAEQEEYYEKFILGKIVEKSEYLERVKEEVDAYRKYKANVDNIARIVDKLNEVRDYLLDICEGGFPELYEDFVRDVYEDNPYEILVFFRAFLREITKE